MKALRLILLFTSLVVLLASSREPDIWADSAYFPILMNKADLSNSVNIFEAREFKKPGKIYLYGDNIYIVDQYSGIHIIDNHDPFNPVKTGFIRIPGVLDLGIKDSVMYVDNAIDLVAIDIRNYPQIEILDRFEEVFPEPAPPDMDDRGWSYRRPKNMVIVDWVKK
ncbi:MAG: hypothetical protein CVT92_01990 [Bacteroidetes bacterium HGW-Bacteroidetes-1]|jgi:hypothetical protein|nr:MAG: hypothetical protein CVT92_01990 [Bacteroidetes bacterium HGW-Bacteroidetes-1]